MSSSYLNRAKILVRKLFVTSYSLIDKYIDHNLLILRFDKDYWQKTLDRPLKAIFVRVISRLYLTSDSCLSIFFK